MPVLFGGHNLPPLVEIGLTNLPKSGGALAPPVPPGTTGLQHQQRCSFQALLPAAEPSQHPEIQIAYFLIILLLFSKNVIEIIVHMSLHKRTLYVLTS